MVKLKQFQVVCIHSYKHDKSLHRVWDNTVVLDVYDDYIVTANKKTKVTESNGRTWYTNEPAICFFYKKYWFNVIAMLKKDGIHFYCNLSSPFLYDGEAIKYIDYDLDIRVYSNGNFQILDENEYLTHQRRMNYPKRIKDIIEKELIVLESKVINEELPFNYEYIRKYANKYFKYLRSAKKGNKQ